jgi:hypothetical protein
MIRRRCVASFLLGYEPNRGSLYRILLELLAEKWFAVEVRGEGDDPHEVREAVSTILGSGGMILNLHGPNPVLSHAIRGSRHSIPGFGVAIPSLSVTIRGSGVTSPGWSVSIPSLSVTIRGSGVTIRGLSVAIPGWGVTIPGWSDSIRGSGVAILSFSAASLGRAREKRGTERGAVNTEAGAAPKNARHLRRRRRIVLEGGPL